MRRKVGAVAGQSWAGEAGAGAGMVGIGKMRFGKRESEALAFGKMRFGKRGEDASAFGSPPHSPSSLSPTPILRPHAVRETLGGRVGFRLDIHGPLS